MMSVLLPYSLRCETGNERIVSHSTVSYSTALSPTVLQIYTQNSAILIAIDSCNLDTVGVR